MSEPPAQPIHVGLFVTCLVDLQRPTVGFASVKLLEDAGCEVSVPAAQTCCGQPAYNSGDNPDARAIAEKVIPAFEPFDYVVAPSGSCAGMIKHHYPLLFDDDPAMTARAKALARKTFELVSFLTDVLNVDSTGAAYDGVVRPGQQQHGPRVHALLAQFEFQLAPALTPVFQRTEAYLAGLVFRREVLKPGSSGRSCFHGGSGMGGDPGVLAYDSMQDTRVTPTRIRPWP